jgi:hypothetical protein
MKNQNKFKLQFVRIDRNRKNGTAEKTSVPNPDRIHKFLGLLDPDPLVRGMDPDPSIIMQK